jgi:hypothetical protein
MPNRYVVPAGGNYFNSATWSATSGGAGGASIPNALDNVFLDANSGNLLIDANVAAGNVDCTGYTGEISWFNDFTWLIGNSTSGSLTLSSGMSIYLADSVGQISFLSTYNDNTITTFGIFLPDITFEGDGGVWLLADNLNAPGRMVALNQGTLDVNGKTITAKTFDTSNGFVRELRTSGGQFILSYSWELSSTTNFSETGLSASSITFTSANAIFNPGGINLEYGGVVFSAIELVVIGTAIGGAVSFTCSSLQVQGASNKYSDMELHGSFTVNSSMACYGYSQAYRLFIHSNTKGVARTISGTGMAILDSVDFQDITFSSSVFGDDLGDAGGNTNITFNTPVTRYWVKNGGNWSDINHWAASSGGTEGQTVPFPQDDVVFDINSFGTPSTVTANAPRLGKNITFTGVSNNPTLNMFGPCSIYGSLVATANMSFSGTALFLAGRGAYSLTTNGLVLDVPIFVDCATGTYSLLDSITINASLILWSGTFDLNDFNCTADGLQAIVEAICELSMGNGNFEILSGNWDAINSQLTITPGNSTIKFKYNGAIDGAINFNGGSHTYHNLEVDIVNSGTWQLNINGNNTFNTITLNADNFVAFQAGATQVVSSFVAVGSPGHLITILSTLSGTRGILSKASGTVTCDYLSLKDSKATGGAVWDAGFNSIDVSNNDGWIFGGVGRLNSNISLFLKAHFPLLNTVSLFINGTFPEFYHVMSLYTLSGLSNANNITLFALGRDNISSSATLVVTGKLSDNSAIPLYISGPVLNANATSMNLYTAGPMPFSINSALTLAVYGGSSNITMFKGMPLFLEAKFGNLLNASMNLYAIGSPEVILNTSMNLYIAGESYGIANSVPLYLYNQLTGADNTLALFIIASGGNDVTSAMNLFLRRDPNEAITLFLKGPAEPVLNSVPLYTYGASLILGNTTLVIPSTIGIENEGVELYTHGF